MYVCMYVYITHLCNIFNKFLIAKDRDTENYLIHSDSKRGCFSLSIQRSIRMVRLPVSRLYLFFSITLGRVSTSVCLDDSSSLLFPPFFRARSRFPVRRPITRIFVHSFDLSSYFRALSGTRYIFFLPFLFAFALAPFVRRSHRPSTTSRGSDRSFDRGATNRSFDSLSIFAFERTRGSQERNLPRIRWSVSLSFFDFPSSYP